MFLLVPVLGVSIDAVVHYMSGFSFAFATTYKAIYDVTDRPLCLFSIGKHWENHVRLVFCLQLGNLTGFH